MNNNARDTFKVEILELYKDADNGKPELLIAVEAFCAAILEEEGRDISELFGEIKTFTVKQLENGRKLAGNPRDEKEAIRIRRSQEIIG